eukprot:TRINITY_DN8606_c0_g1_i1.p1 TRINITY_DN8606_c0_g1~~TRINITY_DN8606_c0_g1_i1.p1  ORF type:complete len:86 (+),score=10.86 TRINITY_DN8606_c0_g1_i1:85-342(+)
MISPTAKVKTKSKFRKRYATAPRNFGALIRKARATGEDSGTRSKKSAKSGSSTDVANKEITEMEQRIRVFLHNEITTDNQQKQEF